MHLRHDRELNKTGVTILLVEQNARVALEVANRGDVMQTGEIVLTGSAADTALERRMIQKAYLGIE